MSTSAVQPPRFVVQDGENSRTVAIDQIPFTIGRQGDRSLPILDDLLPLHSEDDACTEADTGFAGLITSPDFLFIKTRQDFMLATSVVTSTGFPNDQGYGQDSFDARSSKIPFYPLKQQPRRDAA